MSWLFLVGFMGSGKTTLGAAVASRLELPFYDLDSEVVRETGRSIKELFETVGEKAFRDRETAALERLLEASPPGIVATGGGAYLSTRNRELMRSEGTSIWLDVPVEIAAERVQGDERPLWSSGSALRELAARRRKYYRLADFRLELSGDSVERNARKLQALLEKCVPGAVGS